MKPLRFFLLTVMTALFALSSVANADDGAITNKDMSRTINLPDFDQDIVNAAVPEAEHAFTDMMGFYVPAQAASGLVGPIAYCDIDNTPNSGDDCTTNYVEELAVAKPLVNVFIYGPAFGVPHTAFAHRWFDTYAAVSLNDGENWKQTNLSESADQSSFNIEEDHNPSGKGSGATAPSDHNILLPLNAEEGDWAEFHAKGYDTPYTAHCSECHGQGLQGVAEVPACYSCHGNVWTEETPVEIGPIVYSARLDDDNILTIEGENASASAEVSISNAITGELFETTTADGEGKFIYQEEVAEGESPCVVVAEYIDNNGDDYSGPTLEVLTDDHWPDTPEPIESCVGSPLDLTDYPGGAYNVFHATAGNKTLVAWPSRFCQRGQPAYSMTTDNGLEDPDQQARLAAIVGFLQAGDADLGVEGLGDAFSMDNDLYLLDAFGVAGNQGSIDFADEGYPQAGVVPFGCVWTARGVLLPGDDPRTGEVEESHMVWTKAERLTSGRRDPNRIEVKAVKGAGFVITWQEDPEGIRPGQGLGPGEGWSGAVAHSQTDAWYSFINEEYFDIVEDPDTTTTPVAILNHDLLSTGRPQVFVPMAVPMRLSNNAKCNAPDTVTPGGGTPALYCDFELAETFGIKDQCADTVTILTGNENSPDGVTETEICVVDSDGDGTADLVNRANTALTRPRTSLQGYDSADEYGNVSKSAWVIVAAEESKGLGKYFFEPSTDKISAIPCEEGDEPPCTEEIGKNQWYFSFDMGTPDTSAGIGEPNSLVENLVSQGNMLNQGEVYWETGELFGLMRTFDMEDYGEDYNFDILNTEIARRASILVQPISKATASANGLTAIVSWKQGPMRQGGPADTMLRRIVLPENYGTADDCPVIDIEQPAITSASYEGKKLTVVGTGADGDKTTNVYIRNAFTGDFVAKDKDSKTGDFEVEINLTPNPVPCAVQAADQIKDGEGPELYGPWIAVEGAPENCEGPIIYGCNLDGSFTPPGIDINPYAFESMECEAFLIEPGNNPYYPGGVCADPAINLSGVSADLCKDDATGAIVDCPAIDCEAESTYCIGDTDPILQGQIQGEGNTQRILAWHQCPSEWTLVASDGVTPVACETDETNLDDQSWYNPLDISKGHRGFLDGDFVQFLYAWSPNWRLNAKGNDRYDLYVRRSFDGGETWTVTPASFEASDGLSYTGDGTVTCERYRPDTTVPGDRVEPTACYNFAAGAAEHARNITQHKALRITTLDPRYAPTKATITDGCTDGLFYVPDDGIDPADGVFTCDDLSVDYDSDLRDPSRYFMVYETGDNTTVEVGEAEPLDLFYGRAESFGDDYVVWTETDTGYDADPTSACYPTVSYGVEDLGVAEGSGFCNEFDNMNTGGDTHSSEANLEANPDGSKMYGVWAQWVFDEAGEEVVESDAMARRIWWIDEYRSANPDLIYTLPGTQQP